MDFSSSSCPFTVLPIKLSCHISVKLSIIIEPDLTPLMNRAYLNWSVLRRKNVTFSACPGPITRPNGLDATPCGPISNLTTSSMSSVSGVEIVCSNRAAMMKTRKSRPVKGRERTEMCILIETKRKQIVEQRSSLYLYIAVAWVNNFIYIDLCSVSNIQNGQQINNRPSSVCNCLQFKTAARRLLQMASIKDHDRL